MFVLTGVICMCLRGLGDSEFGLIEFVSQVAHDRDTYATSNISP